MKNEKGKRKTVSSQPKLEIAINDMHTCVTYFARDMEDGKFPFFVLINNHEIRYWQMMRCGFQACEGRVGFT